jgi:UDP-N-acetylglucosamine--N-acetylmuramyl-(pentapeptide) pyrophosphoryl-undecaprenol N-acetylglucosamine transferase
MMVAKHTVGHLVVLAAGGTGGHVFPAEALAQELLGQGHRLALITDRRGVAYSGTLGQIETRRISAGAIAGRGILDRAGGMASLALGYFQARQHLLALRPSVVVGFGGYAAAPTVMAAGNLRLATVIHEQNAVLGRANRLLATRVDRVCTSFDLAEPAPEGATVLRTGMPVRPAVAAVRDIAYVAPAQTGPFRILVMGGSQGARVFSDVLPAAIARLPRSQARRLEIAQQCRPEDLERVHAAYGALSVHVQLQAFFDNVPQLLANVHLVIARSGASTVGELSVAGRPSLLVPYPYAADDHQTANAAALAANGGAWVIDQADFTPEALASRLSQVMTAPQLLAETAAAAAAFAIPDAAGRLAGVVTSLIRGENGARHAALAPSAALRPPIAPGAV